ncbi:MAG: VacJ family lipoprotein [Desulfobacteraceae bacterium]|nr:VacJ family lipoprotein [Desulfobacteraceae bacterium]
MEKKSYFSILVIVVSIFLVTQCVFAQDNFLSVPDVSDDFISESFTQNSEKESFLISSNAQAIPEDDDLMDDYDTIESQSVADPFYYFNYVMYTFNDFLVMPIAKGYQFIVPDVVRTGIDNFFHNLLFPVRFVNNLLQGEILDAGSEIGIFLVNSTIGVGGLGQVAQNTFDWHTNDEDFGQTLGSYSIGNGFYIVWPILGPSTFRDTIGLAGDYFLKPINHPNLDFFDYGNPWKIYWGLNVVNGLNTGSFRVDDYDSLKEAAIDPYVALRDAYIQNRAEKVKE